MKKLKVIIIIAALTVTLAGGATGALLYPAD